MLFKVRSAELGEPKRLLFAAKLANPLFCGDLKKIIRIRNRLNKIQMKVRILLIFNLQFQKLL